MEICCEVRPLLLPRDSICLTTSMPYRCICIYTIIIDTIIIDTIIIDTIIIDAIIIDTIKLNIHYNDAYTYDTYLSDRTEHHVLSVQPGGLSRGDEEL
jgi:hypothetical protein